MKKNLYLKPERKTSTQQQNKAKLAHLEDYLCYLNKEKENTLVEIIKIQNKAIN